MTYKYKIIIRTFALILSLLLYHLPTIAGSINLDEVSAYQILDKKDNYPDNSVMFIGSSSIKRWYTLEQDISPIPVIQRGFNAAKLADINMLLKTLVIPHNPKKIVLFAGVNDLAIPPTVGSSEVYQSFLQFVKIIHYHLKDCTIYFIAISPAPKRWNLWEQAEEINQKIKEYSTKQQNIVFIETASALLNENGEPRQELFDKDGIHLNNAGYAIWKKLVYAKITTNPL